MEKRLIYIADDEMNIRNIIRSFLVKEGFEVETFQDGKALLNAFNAKKADLLVLDVMMPKLDGYTLCKVIRETSSVPIIIVSARDTEADRIQGITLGGDDYLTKPFSPMELVVRVKSIFRRMEFAQKGPDSQRVVFLDQLQIDPFTKTADCGGKDVGLTVMEFSVLYYLATHVNKAVSRRELLDKVWGFQNEVETRATDDMIKRIRRKLLEVESTLKIDTIWGYGFSIKNNIESKE